MRIVVTGAAGFIGSHLVDRLLLDGHQVVGVDAFTPYYARERKERNLVGARSSDQFELVEADLRTDDLSGALAGADCVIHEAAMPGLPLSWTDVDGYASCNVVGTARLLAASVDAGIGRFVHVSTSSVYGRTATGDETAPLAPISPYGITKLAAEHLVNAYSDAHGLETVILRYFSVYGPRQRPDMAYHIFIERLRRGEPLQVFGDGRQTRSSTYVADCVEGTLQAMAAGEPGQTYNIGGPAVLSLLDVIEIMAGQLGVEPRIEFAAARVGDQVDTAADCRKAETAFGYRPATGYDAGLAAQVRWHLESLHPE